MSPRAVFAAGTPIRGGVPISFPWFASHPTDASKPAHGFARTRTWQVADVTRDTSGDVRVALRLAADAETRALWSAGFALSLTLSLGAALEMTAEVENVGDDAIVYELAMHTYLAVGDVEAVRIRGLEGARYVDIYNTINHGRYSDELKIDGRRVLARQSDGVHFSREGAVVPARLILRAMAKDYRVLRGDD